MMWPPVPPPAMRTRRFAKSLGLPGYVQQNPDAGQSEEEGSPAGGDQRQRNSFGWHQRQYHADIEEGLQQNGGGDAEGGQPRKGIRGTKCRAQSAHAEKSEQQHN